MPAASGENPASAEYPLGPDDQLKIWVLGVDEITDKPVRVEPSGDIDLPLIGRVHAGGLTIDELKQELVTRFSKEVLKPEISVELLEYGSEPVSIMGAVNHPGVHQVEGRKNLVEVLSLAEGLKPEAGGQINISREIRYGQIPLLGAKTDPTGKYSIASVGVDEVLSGTHPAENIPILPHDVITVPPAPMVYVIGEVKKPGEIPVKTSGMTVLQALATAEGLGPMNSPSHSKIVRVTPGSAERTEIPVDLNKILAGKSEDVAMRPNDILFVPSSIPKKAGARALEAAVQAVTGMAIWGRLP